MDHPELFEKKFSILQEISNAIVVTDNSNAIANLLLDLAVNYANADKGTLMLINEQGELYIFAGRGMDIHFMNSYRVRIGEGIAGIVAKTRTPVLVENIELDERFKKEKRDRYKTNSFISCPVVIKNKLLGVLNINDKKDGTCFTGDELDLLKIIANHAAVALQNSMLMTELRLKAAELEEINIKLIDSDVIKTEFLARVSHELRTPLNSIKGSVYYLQQSEEPSRGEQREFYDIISQETNKLIDLVENLFDFVRVGDETLLLKKSVIDLADLLREVSSSRLLKTALLKKNLSLCLDITEGISYIVGDKIKVYQLFISLIEGLIDFADGRNPIKIQVRENDCVEVTVTLAQQLPEMLISDLFKSKSLFQTDQSEERLKLYLALKIAESHDWKMHAENSDEGFTISLAILKSTRHALEAAVNASLEMFNQFLSEVLDVNSCSIMLTDDLTGELTIRSARGLTEEIVKKTRIRFGDRIAGWVALEGKPLLIDDIEKDPLFGKKNTSQYNTKSLLSLPLKIQDKVIGVINLNNKKTDKSFNERDLQIASVIGERVSHFIEILYEQGFREHDFRTFITSFEGLLNAEKKYHKKSRLLPDLVTAMMETLGAGEDEKRLALYVSLIYDLGLTAVNEVILNKAKLLLPDIRVLRAHPHTTVGMLNGFEFSGVVKKAILHHHERYDGTGYPDRLKGDETPLIARVLAVVDSFCSMIAERPYRKEFTREAALQEIRKGAGTQYDPNIVAAFERVVNSSPVCEGL